jgi:hypothetical protein
VPVEGCVVEVLAHRRTSGHRDRNPSISEGGASG